MYEKVTTKVCEDRSSARVARHSSSSGSVPSVAVAVAVALPLVAWIGTNLWLARNMHSFILDIFMPQWRTPPTKASAIRVRCDEF